MIVTVSHKFISIFGLELFQIFVYLFLRQCDKICVPKVVSLTMQIYTGQYRGSALMVVLMTSSSPSSSTGEQNARNALTSTGMTNQVLLSVLWILVHFESNKNSNYFSPIYICNIMTYYIRYQPRLISSVGWAGWSQAMGSLPFIERPRTLYTLTLWDSDIGQQCWYSGLAMIIY